MLNLKIYDVFGKQYSKDLLTGKVTNLKASAIGNTRLFTGREYEKGLQLYYNRARYYNPELGRFISRDPIDISDDVNLYSYVGNSPVSYSAPMGMEKKASIILNNLVDLFNEKGTYFRNLNINSRFNKIVLYYGYGVSEYNNDDYILNYIFAKEILEGESNIKINQDFVAYSENHPDILYKGNNIGGDFNLNGNRILLSDLGNLLYGYLGQKAGFSYSHLEKSALKATLPKFNFNYIKSLENEINDREYYKLGYELGKNSKTGEVDIEQIKNILLNK